VARNPLHCWSCEIEIDPDVLDFEAFLLPRAANRGGPVLLLRCRNCGMDNVVEGNRAGERLLIPPTLADVKDSNVRGETLARARRWGRENALLRADFLRRAAPAMSATDAIPEVEPEPEPEPEPGGDRPEAAQPAHRQAELNTVLKAYEVLGLELTATPEEIRKRYRELARKCHPDRVAGLDEEIRRTAERRFREVRTAYDMLVGD
jgi:DnaJ-domain-containing protein 1